MCGSLCSFCVSASMPGRLEFMQPAFQVMIFMCEVWLLFILVVVLGGWAVRGVFVVG